MSQNADPPSRRRIYNPLENPHLPQHFRGEFQMHLLAMQIITKLYENPFELEHTHFMAWDTFNLERGCQNAL